MLVYDRLSFRLYDYHCPRLDTEWLLSTLFDASLLSTSKAAGLRRLFFCARCFRVALRSTPSVGNHINGCRWTLVPSRAMICSSYRRAKPDRVTLCEGR